jgi:SAM-dependent methyltransferase
MLLPLGYSYRRALLDEALGEWGSSLGGVVLDVGGKRVLRGRFAPPTGSVKQWTRLNLDATERPDIVADAQALPVRDKAAGSVVCLEVLQYVERPERAVAEIARVLLSDGTALISAPFLHRADTHTDRHRFTEVRLRELVEGAGLRVVQISAQGLFFTTLANFLRQAVARIPLRALRYAVAAVAAPLSALLLGLDRLAVVRRSAFLSSFTTGFLVVARKA